jgi:hypothetical protein
MRIMLQLFMVTYNEASVAIANNPIHHQRSKHIDIKYHYVCDSITDGCVVTETVRSDQGATFSSPPILSPVLPFDQDTDQDASFRRYPVISKFQDISRQIKTSIRLDLS